MYPLGIFLLVRGGGHFLRKLVCPRPFCEQRSFYSQNKTMSIHRSLKHFSRFLLEIVNIALLCLSSK